MRFGGALFVKSTKYGEVLLCGRLKFLALLRKSIYGKIEFMKGFKFTFLHIVLYLGRN